MKKKSSQLPPVAPVAPTTRYECETFRNVGPLEMNQLSCSWRVPYVFNGIVGIRKWRVVAELIEESREVLIARLQKLWDECDNIHHRGPLREEAKKLGNELEYK